MTDKLYYRYWGKARSDNENGPGYHLMPYHCLDEALAAFHRAAAEWGLPVIIQSRVSGEELNVIALGDGEGGMLGAVAMRKMVLTDKGKGWAGITIKDPALLSVAERFIQATKWRGPCEVEVMRDEKGAYHLLEINPRFPAWVHLSAAAGMNLPRATAQLAAGRRPPVLRDYEVGKMFVRISLDQIADLSDFERIVTAGEAVTEDESRDTAPAPLSGAA
jgi:carbamoyl-phosphate synthase large subunit